jgi:serine/threonine protein kinase
MDSNRLGHFDLLQKIGEGGMGVVYKARDSRLERLVAIKVLPESRASDAERRARFIQEAKAASALNHPNIVTIHEVGEQDGRTFIVMEFVDGKSLNELIPRKGMKLTEALRVAAQVADALTAAHAAGIVHRDLKPGNIMVDAQGRVKVLDFGLAKQTAPAPAPDEETRTAPLTEEGAIVGSVPYMSPEQAEGRPVDARSDIFSFGAVLYEMVTGQRAFRGDSRISTLAAVVEKEPQPIGETGAVVPPELERLITRCLRKEVNRRSQHMSDLTLALEELRDESESGKREQPPVMRRRWLWPAVCAAVAMGAVTWAYLHHRGTAPPKTRDLVRLSPDDGHFYDSPSISPDGKFVAYVSNRGGQRQVWLQQVGAGEPIQLTNSTNYVDDVVFFPTGTQILFTTLDTTSYKAAFKPSLHSVDNHVCCGPEG